MRKISARLASSGFGTDIFTSKRPERISESSTRCGKFVVATTMTFGLASMRSFISCLKMPATALIAWLAASPPEPA